MKARASQIIWVVDHLHDLEADFRVFYRIEDIYAMPSAQFLQFAWRVGAYQGAVAAQMERRAEKIKARPTVPKTGPTTLSRETRGSGEVVAVETNTSYLHDLLPKE